jgi:hypothetical protein
MQVDRNAFGFVRTLPPITGYPLGFYSGIVVTTLERHDSKVDAQTEILHFPRPRYVTWESQELADEEWIELGHDSIHYRKGENKPERIKYKRSYVLEPVILKGEVVEYQFRDEVRFDKGAVYHLVLPPYHLPDDASIRDSSPSRKKIGDRIALTFVDKEEPGLASAALAFREVDKEKFQSYKAEGETQFVRISPHMKRTLITLMLKPLKKEGEEILSTAWAKVIEDMMGS